MTDGTHITLRDVVIDRAGRRILDIAQLDISAGQFINLIGPNGAGKTTLLNVCCGLMRPDSGAVAFGGVRLDTLSGWAKSRLRKRIGTIPQRSEYNAELPFTVREVAVMGRTACKPLGMPLGKSDMEITDHWLATLGIADRRNQTFRSLSGGQQQKVLIARAMAQEPELLILDEPAANLDVHWKFQMLDLIAALHRQLKLTIVLVSHEIQSLPPTADRTLLLHHGRIVADGPTPDVLASSALAEVYGCRVNIIAIDQRSYVYCRPLQESGA